jgi:hypothetical protein
MCYRYEDNIDITISLTFHALKLKNLTAESELIVVVVVVVVVVIRLLCINMLAE